MKEKILKSIIGDRVNPTLLNPTRYTFIAIKKFLQDSVNTYKKKKKGKLDILDFGCGNQPYKYIFNYDNYIGCDIGDSPEKNERMSIILDGDKLPYKDNSFDIIICTEVLEHLKDPKLYSNELHRVLKKGGLLLLTVPQIWNYHPYPQHYFMYTPDGIKLFFDKLFLKIDFFSDTRPFQTGLLILIMYTNFKIYFLKGLFVLLVNIFFLHNPMYKEYNNSSSHIFIKLIK